MKKLNDLLRAVTLFVCLLATASFAQAATFIQLSGDPGEAIFRGEQRFTPADGAFSFGVGIPGEVNVFFQGSAAPDLFWALNFAPADGTSLQPNIYPSARRVATLTHPGLDVSGEGSACNQSYGRFVIWELERAVDGSIVKFAADFEQHCERSLSSLFGGVRVNSDIPYVQLPRMMSAPTFLTVVTRWADPIWAGQEFHYEPDQAYFTLREDSSQGFELDVRSGPPFYDYWLAQFQSSLGQPLVAGTYENATHYSFPPRANAELWVSNVGNACLESTGRFDVAELVREDDGLITSLAVDYELHCWPEAPPVFGSIRVNSNVPYVPPPPPPPPPFVAHLTTDQPTDLTLLPAIGLADLVVRVLDDSSAPVAGMVVRFQVTNGCGGGVAGYGRLDVITDAAGYARTSFGSDVSGLCTVKASIESGASLQFNILVDKILLTFNPRTTIVTTGSDFTITVEARDPAGQTLEGVPVTLYFSCLGDSHCVAQSQLDATTDANGRANFAAIAGTYAATTTVTAYTVGFNQGQATGTVVQRVPYVSPPLGFYQDMWWGGPEQNGWGMSIVQHDDKLFSVIYAYDAGGSSTWFVMPAGTWDETNTIYSGPLYIPHGAPYFAYDTGRFGSGAPVGNARITFVDSNHATLEYTINGQSGRKDITRQLFGPPSSQSVPERGDMWWGGGSQNGWGIAVLQQFSTLFTVWFTYDAGGSPTWFVLPSGTWTASDTYEGRVYRTTGSPWIGTGYNASQLQAMDVGSFRLRFSGINATFDYNVEGRTGTLSLERQPF